jgi:phosphoenolpyruvate carboxykinase (GTP)
MTPIGLLPNEDDLNLAGLDIRQEYLEELLRVDTAAWRAEVPDVERHFARFGDRLPERLRNQLAELRGRLETASDRVLVG